MKTPRRWVDDPSADPELRDVLRGTPRAAGLDDVTRRRLNAKIARASALPALAAGWLFVKSAGAALGVVLGAGAVASYVGVVDWSPSRAAVPEASAPRAAEPRRAPLPLPSPVAPQPPEAAPEPQPALNPAPSLPVTSASGSAGSLSQEALLLEQARREMRAAPAVALSIASEHEARFPRGQLASERALIRIEALHRLGRDVEAITQARALLSGRSGGLYAERVRKLLGERAFER